MENFVAGFIVRAGVMKVTSKCSQDFAYSKCEEKIGMLMEEEEWMYI